MTRDVCYLGYELHPPWVEGTRVLTRDVIEAVRANTDLRASVVSTLTPGATAWDDDAVEYVSPTVVSSVADRLGRHGNNVDALMFAKMALELRRKIRAGDVDLVHAGFASHTVFSAVCAIPPSVPFVAHVFGKVEHQSALRLLRTHDRVDAYVTSSRTDVENLRSMGVEDVHLIPPPIPLRDGDPRTGRDLLSVSENSFVVGYIGNLDPERFPTAFADALASFAAERGTEAVVVTKDAGGRTLPPEIRVVERALSDAQKSDVYAAADVWVFPFSFPSPETAPVIDPPLTVLEAMAAGRPVVTTRSLSLPDYVTDGEHGFLHEPGAARDVVASLRALRDGDESPSELGARARRHVSRELAPARTARRLRAVYDRVSRE